MLISKTIDDALVEIGVKNPIEEATPQDHEFGLRTLNRIVDLFNTQNLLITYLEEITYKMPTNGWENCITIGHGMQIDTVAPANIEDLFWRESKTDYSSIAMSYNQWSGIAEKSSESIPTTHYIQKMDNNSIKICFDCIPVRGLELHVMAKMPWTGKNSNGNEYLPTDDIKWGFGIEKLLMHKLAFELCDSYSVSPSESLFLKMQMSEDAVKSYNYQPSTLRSDPTLNRYKISTRFNRARY